MEEYKINLNTRREQCIYLFIFHFQGHSTKMKHDLKGNKVQNGGVLIVKKGGQEVLLSYRQENPADHVENSQVLKVLGIKESENMLPDSHSQRL